MLTKLVSVANDQLVTVQTCFAGVRSTLPAESTARTWNVWLPGLTGLYLFGELQLDQSFCQSGLHWKSEPRSVDVNVNRAARDVVVGGGPAVMRVLGGVLSALAGFARTLRVTVADGPDDPRAVPRYRNVSLPLRVASGV
jgi:hypothetical protein